MGGRIIPFTPQEGQGMPALDNTPVSRTQATVLRKALEEAARLRASQEAEGKPDGLAVARMQGELRGEFFAEFLCEVGKCPARLYSTALAWMAARGCRGFPYRGKLNCWQQSTQWSTGFPQCGAISGP